MPDSRLRGPSRADMPRLRIDWSDDNPWRYSSGVAFPPSPALHEQCFRTDIRGGMMFRWNGTYWLSEQLFTAGLTGGSFAIITLASDMFVERVDAAYQSASGTNGSNYRTYTVSGFLVGGTTASVIATLFTTQADGASAHKDKSVSVGVLASASTHRTMSVTSTATGSPGNDTQYAIVMAYRLRAT